mmetsp:Transcript_11185/g.22016  ORF Transcript_11185/g.22016 Transcript_11185/m.22016 type:complete len:115 (+) Transcript_11185:1308-1652(+)
MTHYYEIVKEVDRRLGNLAVTTGYGHIGDCNLHINCVVKDRNDVGKVKELLDPFIYEYLKNVRGSISAEHGVGLMKFEKLHYTKDATSIKYMKALKNLFDPKGILNPYKVMTSS